MNSTRNRLSLSAAIIVLAFFPPCSAARPATSDSTALMQEIARLEQEYGGHLGFAAKNLATGEVVRYRGDERFPTASVIKLPLMAAFYHFVDRKEVNPDLRFTLKAEDVKSGSPFLENISPGLALTLLDAVKMMIIVSDNTATNLVFRSLGPDHQSRLRAVNGFLDEKGLGNIRFLNPPGSFATKMRTADATRYGIGVSTPDDMVALLEALFRGTLSDSSSCAAMIEILKAATSEQIYHDMVPRYLPAATCKFLDVAHKTGSIQEVKADVGLVLSDRVNFAIAVFVDKHPDHRDEVQNRAVLLIAHVARAVWNHFTGDRGYERPVAQGHVDWTSIPGGEWAIYRTSAAPFPHRDRMRGLIAEDSTFFPLFPHYLDSSVVVFVPDGFKETEKGINLIVHFHGWMYDNLKVLHHSQMCQTMVDQKLNALLVLPQGPYFAKDSFCGKMEDEGGFRRLVEDVLAAMKREGIVKSEKVGDIIVSAHSGGFRPAALVLERGGLSDHVTDVFLFDAFYSRQDKFKSWLLKYQGRMFGCYTDHLAKEHMEFEQDLKPQVGNRLQFTRSPVEHDDVVETFFPQWVRQLGPEWKQ
jgi:beta-lactamase class A